MGTVRDRRSARIKFPKGERPRLLINEVAFEIVDLSVSGLKFIIHTQSRPNRGQVMPVEIQLLMGKRHRTVARVVRNMGYLCCLELKEHLPAVWLEKEYLKVFQPRP